jgi:nucleoside-diphosphate-sugar epimerase
MRVFLTGATGFIGGHIARQLRDRGDDVVALVRRPEKAADLRALDVEVTRGDVTDAASVRRAMQGCDAIIHTAAWYKVGVRDKRPAYPTNVEGTRSVLHAMRDLQIPRGVYTSTVGVYSDTHGELVDETYAYRGPWITHYEHTKWQAHVEVALPLMAQGLPLVIVMPGLVYGPGDGGPTHDFLVDYLRGRLRMAPHGTAFCWGHVEDVAAGHLLALDRGRPGETYHLTGPAHTMHEILDVLGALTGRSGPRWCPRARTVRALGRMLGALGRLVPLPPMLTDEVVLGIAGTTYIASDAKARRELGFAPRPVRQGLPDAVAWEMQRLGMPLPASLQAPEAPQVSPP